jgi:hypothetical protein
MIINKCPHCNGYLTFNMDYNYGNPVIVYTCENCRYTIFGDAYMTDNKTAVTTGASAITSTETIYTTNKY